MSANWLRVLPFESSQTGNKNIFVFLGIIDLLNFFELVLDSFFLTESTEVLESEFLLTCFLDEREYPAEPNFIVPFSISNLRWSFREVNISFICFLSCLWLILLASGVSLYLSLFFLWVVRLDFFILFIHLNLNFLKFSQIIS